MADAMPPAYEVCTEHINVVLDPTHIGVEEVADHAGAQVSLGRHRKVSEWYTRNVDGLHIEQGVLWMHV